MNKATYLAQKDVIDFVDWFSKRLCSSDLSHSWIDRRNGKQVSFDSVFDAYKRYSWCFNFTNPIPPGGIVKGKLFPDSCAALCQIKINLTTAIKNQIDKDVRIWTQTLMRWGGVYPGNGTWLHNNEVGLAKTLNYIASLLGPHAAEAQLKSISRFNSGMTKIYSLLVDDFIIYDTRVAAALTWIIRLYCEDKNFTIPDNLCFPVGKAKESPTQINPKCRNPSKGNLKFPPLTPGADHAVWNRKASWLLQDVLAKADAESCFNQLPPSGRLRALEAALFMIGYDIPDGATCNKPSESQTKKPEVVVEINAEEKTSYPFVTRGGVNKQKGFRYEITDSGLDIFTDRVTNHGLLKVSFAQLECIMQTLDNQFPKKYFPLENSKPIKHKKILNPGLGLASTECGIADATCASYIGPILEDLGFLEWNGKRKGIEWKLVDQPASAAEIKDRVLQNLDA